MIYLFAAAFTASVLLAYDYGKGVGFRYGKGVFMMLQIQAWQHFMSTLNYEDKERFELLVRQYNEKEIGKL